MNKKEFFRFSFPKITICLETANTQTALYQIRRRALSLKTLPSFSVWGLCLKEAKAPIHIVCGLPMMK